MRETRFGKLGRLEANFFCWAISNSLPEENVLKYLNRFLAELAKYSDMPRKKGTPANAGIVYELENINNLLPFAPEAVAKIVKERWHTKYQKQNSKRELRAYTAEIRRYFNLDKSSTSAYPALRSTASRHEK